MTVVMFFFSTPNVCQTLLHVWRSSSGHPWPRGPSGRPNIAGTVRQPSLFSSHRGICHRPQPWTVTVFAWTQPSCTCGSAAVDQTLMDGLDLHMHAWLIMCMHGPVSVLFSRCELLPGSFWPQLRTLCPFPCKAEFWARLPSWEHLTNLVCL